MKTLRILMCCFLLALTRAAPKIEVRTPILANDFPVGEHIEGRIISGSTAAFGQFPWQASIRSSNGSSTSICGGSLISSGWILTAAHCTVGFALFTIGLGSNLLNAPLYTRTSTTAVSHPNYNSENLNNDIAVIQLPTNVPNSVFVKPILLPTLSQATTTFANVDAIVSGFGWVNETAPGMSNTLQYANVQVITNSMCEPTYGSSVIIHSTLCTKGISSNPLASFCKGDSGGPLIYSPSANVWRQIGVVSFTAAVSCQQGYPDGYTRTASYLNWINNVTGIALTN